MCKKAIAAALLSVLVSLPLIPPGLPIALTREPDFPQLESLAGEWFPDGVQWRIVNFARIQPSPDDFLRTYTDFNNRSGVGNRLVLSGECVRGIALSLSNSSFSSSSSSGCSYSWFRTLWAINGESYESITVVLENSSSDNNSNNNSDVIDIIDSIASFFCKIEELDETSYYPHSSVGDKFSVLHWHGYSFDSPMCYGGLSITASMDVSLKWKGGKVYDVAFNWYLGYSLHAALKKRPPGDAPVEVPIPESYSRLRLSTSSSISMVTAVSKSAVLDLTAYETNKIILSSAHMSERHSNSTSQSALEGGEIVDGGNEIENIPMVYSFVLTGWRGGGTIPIVSKTNQRTSLEAWNKPKITCTVRHIYSGREGIGPVRLVADIVNPNRETDVEIEFADMEESDWIFTGEGVFVPRNSSMKYTVIGLISLRNPTPPSPVVLDPQTNPLKMTVRLKYNATGVVNSYYSEEVTTIPYNDTISIEGEGPDLVLTSGRITVDDCGWGEEQFYLEPVSKFKLISAVIKNRGGIGAENVRVWLLFRSAENPLKNWTVDMADPPFDLPAGSERRAVESYKFDLRLCGMRPPENYIIELHVNYSYLNSSNWNHVSTELYVTECLYWRREESPNFVKGTYKVDVTVDCIKPKIRVHNENASITGLNSYQNGAIKLNISYAGYTELKISIRVIPDKPISIPLPYKRPYTEPWEPIIMALGILGAIVGVIGEVSLSDIGALIGLVCTDAALTPLFIEAVEYFTYMKLQPLQAWAFSWDESPKLTIVNDEIVLSREDREMICIAELSAKDEATKWYDRDETGYHQGATSSMLDYAVIQNFPFLENYKHIFANGYDFALVNYIIWLTHEYRVNNSAVKTASEPICSTIFIDIDNKLADLRNTIDLDIWHAILYGTISAFLYAVSCLVMLIISMLSWNPSAWSTLMFLMRLLILLLVTGTCTYLLFHATMESVKSVLRTFNSFRDPPVDEDYSKPVEVEHIDLPGIDSDTEMKISLLHAAAKSAKMASLASLANDSEAANERLKESTAYLSQLPSEIDIPALNITTVYFDNESDAAKILYNYFNETVPLPEMPSGNITLNISTNETRVVLDLPTVESEYEYDSELSHLNESAWQMFESGDYYGAYGLTRELMNRALSKNSMSYYSWAAKLISLINDMYRCDVRIDGELYAGGENSITLTVSHRRNCSVSGLILVDGAETANFSEYFENGGEDRIDEVCHSAERQQREGRIQDSVGTG